jgi:hypothetical protein
MINLYVFILHGSWMVALNFHILSSLLIIIIPIISGCITFEKLSVNNRKVK